MIGCLWAALGLIGSVLLAAIGELVSDEIRCWLDRVPCAVLRLAAAQLDPAQRETIYQDEWLPELTYALRGKECRPITRLIIGTKLTTGLLISSRRIARSLHRALPADAPSTPQAPHFRATATNETGQPIQLGTNLLLATGDTLEVRAESGMETFAHLRELGLAGELITVHEIPASSGPPAAAR